MAGWHHQLDGCESEWTPGVGDEQGGLTCCDSWGRKESDMTERLHFFTSLLLSSKESIPVLYFHFMEEDGNKIQEYLAALRG